MKKRNIVKAVSFLGLVFAFIGLKSAGLFDWLENKTYDSRMKATASFVAPSNNIGVILLDQESLNWARTELGWSWPWPRAAYGQMLDYFNRGGAACVAFDMIYSEESIYGANDDIDFAKACERSGRAVLAVHTKLQDDGKTLDTKPVPVLEKACARLGNVTGLSDSDGVIRQESDETFGLHTLSFAMLDLNGQIPSKIKYSGNGRINIRFLEGLERYVPYSAKTILKSEYAIREAEKLGMSLSEVDFDKGDLISPEQFKDNYVFFGLYAPGLFDICSTPIAADYQGVGVHISLLDTVLQENWLVETPWYADFFILLIMVFGGFIFGSSALQKIIRSFSLRSFIVGLKLVFYIALAYILFYNGFIIPLGSAVAAFIVSFFVFVFEDYVTEGHQKKYLREAFSQYLSPTVINELVDNPSRLKLGGEEVEITAYFSDVQGFTSISEGLKPRQLTELLNKYLSAMTDIILSHGGTIDKYEGDAIIAFWGAPVRQEDHALRAVEAALDCQKKLSEMAEELEKECGTVFRQRIGLNTGLAVVGNMGSSKRFDYTMMGDTVNLASRLEGMNKQFGTYLMCSRATMESAVKNGSTSSYRELGTVAVVGKKNGVTVYTPMSAQDFKANEELYVEFDKARILFKDGKFKEAQQAFNKISNDGPSTKYAEKCEALINNPPKDWDGVIKATEK